MSSVLPSIFYTLISIDLIGRPSFLGKVRWMVLTSPLKSSSANTDFLLKAIGYRMHKTYIRLNLGFLPSSLALLVVLGFLLFSIFSTTFSLVTVTSVKSTKTDTSFLTLVSISKDPCWRNSFFSCCGNIWLERYLLLVFWEAHWHLLPRSLILISTFICAKNLLGSFGLFLGWLRMSGR